MSEILQFFRYEHLKPAMQNVSRPFCELAQDLCNESLPLGIPSNPQREKALEFLLLAKDAAVRASIYEYSEGKSTDEEYKLLGEVWETPRTISIRDLADHRARTLLWGYTSDRQDFHVYIRNRKLHLYIYGQGYFNGDAPFYKCGTELPLEGIIPDKRLHPEACDYVFCRRLKERGVYLPFTTWDATRVPLQFYGKIYEENA